MGFIAALMLSYMPEEESFWVLRALLSSGCDDTAEGCGPGRKGPKHAMRLMCKFRASLREASHLRA